MGGFFGVVSREDDCICDLFYGTDYHSHLGTKRGGLAVIDKKNKIYRRIHDISNAQFRSKFDDDIDSFVGRCGIGVISDFEDQPLVISSKFGTYSLVTVGRINNLQEIVEEAYDNHYSHFSEMSEGEINPTEVVAYLINQGDDIISGMEHAQRKIDGSCSILVLYGQALYTARDQYGRTPVMIGERADSMCVTMETTALPNLGYKLKHELGPGEIIKIANNRMIQKKKPGETMKICTFLWVYYGYPSSTYEGINAEVARCRNGAMIAAEDKDVDFDSVCGIPDSGIAHAVGYSNATDKPYVRAFVKYTPTWPRSFTPQCQQIRNLIAHMKLIPVEEHIRDKKLMFCDDSIVRGTQLRETVTRLYEMGAAEIHMRSACPPLLFACRYLNISRSRTEMDLAARRAIAHIEKDVLTPEILEKYTQYGTPEYFNMVEHIRKDLRLHTLKFQPLDKLLEAISLPKEKFCTYCWTGRDVGDTMCKVHD